MSHTPGKWRLSTPEEYEDDGFAGSVVSDDDGEVWYIAAVCLGLPNGQVEANARLLAAAPDLLEALEWAMNQHGLHSEPNLIPKQNQDYFDNWHKARAAIAKAKS